MYTANNEQAVKGRFTSALSLQFLISPLSDPGPLIDIYSLHTNATCNPASGHWLIGEVHRAAIINICKASEFERRADYFRYHIQPHLPFHLLVYRVSLALLRLARIEMNNSIKLL
jgi:hypothetical protein